MAFSIRIHFDMLYDFDMLIDYNYFIIKEKWFNIHHKSGFTIGNKNTKYNIIFFRGKIFYLVYHYT